MYIELPPNGASCGAYKTNIFCEINDFGNKPASFTGDLGMLRVLRYKTTGRVPSGFSKL